MVDRAADSALKNVNWREKYLDALDSQEKMEQQLDALRRLLIHLSVSADGQDDQLDEALDQLRRQLRGDAENSDGIAKLFRKLDQVVAGFEQRRRDSAEDMRQSLVASVLPLQAAPLSRSLKKEITHYLSQLPTRSEKVRLYPALLQQLASIQQQALTEIQQPSVSFWQKIFTRSRSRSATDSSPAVIADKKNPDDEHQSIDHPLLTAHQLSDQDEIVLATEVKSNHELAANISQVLQKILANIEVPDSSEMEVGVLRQRVTQQLTNENLASTLEHVGNLVIEAYLAANRAFASYLNSVNFELMSIHSVLGGAVQNEMDRRQASRDLEDAMLQEVAVIQTDVAEATDLKQLKEKVNSQLGNIRQTLDNFKQSDQQSSLTGQLQSLAEKIKSMEEDAEKNRSTMEKHRYKAMHDPLTELPNREAYNERVDIEWQRWQRYAHPLTLAVCDLDHFKKINDTFGHQAGDRVLKIISRSIAQRLREVDFFGRYGGEEFVVIMPETSAKQALGVLEKIRAAIAKTAFNYKDAPLTISLSMGITEFRPGDTVESAFARADKALYAAKAAGRNQCQVAD